MKYNFKKPFFAQIIFLIALLGIVFLFKPSFDFSNSSSSNLATLVINLETGGRFFEGEVVKDMTTLDALNAATSVGKIKLNYAIDRAGNVNIREIDGQTNGIGNKYFVFYLNNKKIATKDLNNIMIKENDKIEIRFE